MCQCTPQNPCPIRDHRAFISYHNWILSRTRNEACAPKSLSYDSPILYLASASHGARIVVSMAA
ncbi:acetyl-CoA carboxylase subunit beta [Sesbania bispinosa]|nr:acetyl-CoA carboxylase subunit beta [Sesbania bispinosa]